MYTYDWFLLLYGKTQHITVKQLSSNQKYICINNDYPLKSKMHFQLSKFSSISFVFLHLYSIIWTAFHMQIGHCI